MATRSCGKESLGVEVRVVKTDGEGVQPEEIIAHGPNTMLGYWHLPEASATLVDGWYLTGDLATIGAENFFYIVARAKDMSISGGENIYRGEVENALYTHPSVLEAEVVFTNLARMRAAMSSFHSFALRSHAT
jgi:acyl-CoA synthetase (AMP-forming)/AMP-acid ligase II